MNDRALATRKPSGFLARVLCPVMMATALLIPAGCGGGSSGSGEEPALVVVNFNQNLLPGVLLNSPLVFVFSAPLDPLTVNSSTIEIWTTVNSQRVDAVGRFEVDGATVTWRPQMTNQVYPLHTGGTANQNVPTMPADSGLNTLWQLGLTYNVSIASAATTPNSVKSISGRPLVEAFVSQFETAQAPNSLTVANSNSMRSVFDSRAEFFRNSMRVADPFLYSGTASPPVDYLGWLSNPAATNGENPLFVNSQIVPNGIAQWTGRDRTGLDADLNLRIQIVPPMTAQDMANNVFPAGAPREERYVSNLSGVAQGRTVPVTGIVIYLSQPIAPDSFLTATNNPKPGGGTSPNASPIRIRNTMTPDPNPTITPLTYTLSFQNDTRMQAARIECTFTQPITQGWIHVDVTTSGVKGMPGGELEGNESASDFTFIWPVRINAQ